MKPSRLIKPILLLLSLTSLSACAFNFSFHEETIEISESNNVTSSSQPSSSQGASSQTPSSSLPEAEEGIVKGRTILHCFDWSINNIKNSLDNIKAAGFDAVQLSPMQPQKDPYNGKWRDQWWKLYQPLGFKVAGNNENVLGNKQDLISLCQAAESKGIDVIVDIVANHLASDNKRLYNKVQPFEPDIYSQNLIHNTGKSIDEDVIRGNMQELCDLQTENALVQSRVSSMLNEYVDCGVDGFRFDAAKHIETEFDNEQYRSDFWINTLDAAEARYEQRYGREMFNYGEILGSVGPGRQYSYYTGRMSITDSDQGSDVLKASRGNTAYVKQSYNTKQWASKLVLWAESHDTYSNSWGESKDDTLQTIHKGYAMQASRKNASVLYFARPNDNGNIGEIGDTSYQGLTVKSINSFREQCFGRDERVSTSNGCFVNVRGNKGAAVVRLTGTSAEIDVGLPNGAYKDLISNANMTIANGKLALPATSTYALLINENAQDDVVVPTLQTEYQQVYSGTQQIKVTAEHHTSLTYSINNGEEMELHGNILEMPTSLDNGKVSVKFKASNQYGVTSGVIHLIKTDALVAKQVLITDMPTGFKYYIWAWGDNIQGNWKTPSQEGDIIGFDLAGASSFIIVKFASTVSSPDWNKKVNQTEDISFSKRIYSYEDFEIAS